MNNSTVDRTSNLNNGLSPCPFCGDSQLGQMQMTSFDETPPRKWMRVKCDTCGAMAPDTAWNQRSVANVRLVQYRSLAEEFISSNDLDEPRRSATRFFADWLDWRDAQKANASETGDDLGNQIYALLVRRGYAQHEAHLIANGPGCTSDCVQKGYPDIACPAHGANAQKALERRCVCGLAVIPEGELRVEVGASTHRLAGPCFQTSSSGKEGQRE